MTRSEFIKEIVKKGNIIIELGECSSYLDVYKLMGTYGSNEEQIKADLLYSHGNPSSNYRVAFSIRLLINESTNRFNHYIVVEEYQWDIKYIVKDFSKKKIC